jgi:arylsulfatase A-like enzyme
MPTLAEIAGFPIPKNLDGISFLPILSKKGTQNKHENLYWEFHELDGRQALLRNDWKLVRYHVFTPEKTTTELYNLRTDIGEEKNVSAEHPQLVKEMIGILKNSRIDSDIFPFRK